MENSQLNTYEACNRKKNFFLYISAKNYWNYNPNHDTEKKNDACVIHQGGCAYEIVLKSTDCMLQDAEVAAITDNKIEKIVNKKMAEIEEKEKKVKEEDAKIKQVNIIFLVKIVVQKRDIRKKNYAQYYSQNLETCCLTNNRNVKSVIMNRTFSFKDNIVCFDYNQYGSWIILCNVYFYFLVAMLSKSWHCKERSCLCQTK